MSCIAQQIAQVLLSENKELNSPKSRITYLAMDTRKLIHPKETLFFALRGSMHDGHNFIRDAVDQGVKNIVVEDEPIDLPEDVNCFRVPNTLKALQSVAAWHKSRFRNLTTLAITGSNGKTTVKEWLYQMITDRRVVKNPKSYNSQTGVALSLWQIQDDDRLGIFEAGISTRNEMAALEAMIRPDLGLFTTLGDAHAEGFRSLQEKLEEKLILFKHCPTIIYNADDAIVDTALQQMYAQKSLLSWGKSPQSTLFQIVSSTLSQVQTYLTIKYQNHTYQYVVPFADKASVQNALHCIAVMLTLGMDQPAIQQGLYRIQNIPMRLELKFGLYNNILVNDTYNADLQSFKIAMDFLDQQAGMRDKVVILSEFMQMGMTTEELNQNLADQINNHKIKEVFAIGAQIRGLEYLLDKMIVFHPIANTEIFLEELPNYILKDKAILIKGARKFELERITHALSDKAHTATLETDLQAIEHNLRVFSNHLTEHTQIIAVIKASAYGSGSEELAKFLEFKKVSYLAVAFVDEGVQLRKTGIKVPIIILNPDKNGIPDMVKYNLEPEIYDLQQLQELLSYLHTPISHFKIHLKMDTGMHRLGFVEADLPHLCDLLVKHSDQIVVQTIFSHLSSSEDPHDDEYTHNQAKTLITYYDYITSNLGYKPAKHILNSSGIIRFPEYHFDFVRLGLGLYGIDGTNIFTDKLEKVHTLKASVVQLKHLNASETIGYNRKGMLTHDGKIAIINIGYADGLMRLAGNGKYSVRIRGREYLIIGNVCMDLTIIDLGNDDNIQIGDEVIIFGKDKPIEDLADACQTIPYEILTRISGRIKRSYVNA